MPIKGMTDRGASFPRLGELRKGGVKPATGNKPGPDLKHFRFTSKNDDALQKFHAIYGKEPTAVNVFLPFSTTDENFEAWREQWVAGGLVHRCDGETAVIWRDGSGYSQEPKPCPGGCKQVGRLKVIIPELERLAYVVALTTSTHDIIELHANISAIEAMRGDLRGIPFILSRVPRMISTPSGKPGKRARREKWLLHIEAAPDWVQAQLSTMAQQALPGQSSPVVIPANVDAPDEIDTETGEYVETEPVDDTGYPIRLILSEPSVLNDVIKNASPEALAKIAADKRGATSPQAQAKRERPSAPPFDGEPRPASSVIAALQTAASGKDNPASDGQLKFMRASLSKVAGSKDKAAAFLAHVFDLTTSADCTSGQAAAIIEWAGANKENGYEPLPQAAQELERIYTAWMKGQRQADLFPNAN